MSQEDTKTETVAVANTEPQMTAIPKNPISDRGGPPDIPKKTLGKLSCFARGSNIDCLVSHEDIMPQKPARRVRDLGREIVDRANRCTWYDHMVEGEMISFGKKNAKEIPVPDEAQSEGGDASEKTSSVDLCGDENDNKMLLKRLEKQQKALLKQQHALNKQLGLEANPVELGSIDSKIELTDEADKIPYKNSPKKFASHQRRLRGDVAKQCAARSEGSIKSLIWNDDLFADDVSIKPSQIDAKSTSSSTSVEANSRLIERTSSCSGKINSSSAISALISNSFCNSLQ